MSKEFLSGHTNSVYRDEDGTIVKTFEDLGISSRSAQLRLHSEAHALTHYPLTPNLIDVTENRLTMTCVVGQNHLNEEIPHLNEPQKNVLYETVGKTLKLVHGFQKASHVTPRYHKDLAAEAHAKTRQLNRRLEHLGINHNALSSYFLNAYEPDEVKKWGITVVHGDYWLDNVIVKSLAKPEPAGVIDWEMSGVGSPYLDFASVYLTIEMPFEGSADFFWRGYGALPKQSVKEYFATFQIINWLCGDNEANPESSFYAPKLALVRRLIG